MNVPTFTADRGIKIYYCTKEYIQSLKVGDFAPDCFGNMRKITRIFGELRPNCKGKLCINYYTEHGPTSQISNGATEGQIFHNVITSNYWTSAELDEIERQIFANIKE